MLQASGVGRCDQGLHGCQYMPKFTLFNLISTLFKVFQSRLVNFSVTLSNMEPEDSMCS